jgi:hypothetical protein
MVPAAEQRGTLQALASTGVSPARGRALPSMHWAAVVLLRRREHQVEIFSKGCGQPSARQAAEWEHTGLGCPAAGRSCAGARRCESREEAFTECGSEGGLPDEPSRFGRGSLLRPERPCAPSRSAASLPTGGGRRSATVPGTRETFGSESEGTASLSTPIRFVDEGGAARDAVRKGGFITHPS